MFKHLLPEISIAGHSNVGKSSLVNAITGLGHKKGPAGVSDRAGWTDQICFYQLGKRPPKFTLVDFPGYGFAVASTDQKRRWKKMTLNYLESRGSYNFFRNIMHYLRKIILLIYLYVLTLISYTKLLLCIS